MEETMTLTKQPSLFKSKIRAASIHLSISGVIFLILSYFIVFWWYPFPYFTADGGWQGIRIIAMVDLVLGPCLTLIIFNSNKSLREIRFDLGTIALIQVCALVWGIYTVHQERPAAIVHWDGEFFTVPAKTFNEQNVSIDSLAQFSDEKPPLIQTHRSTDVAELIEMLRLINEEKIAPFEQVNLYRSFKDNKNSIFANSLDIETIISVNAAMKQEFEHFLDRMGGNQNDYIYMPLNARYHNVILIFSREGNVLGSLDAPYNK